MSAPHGMRYRNGKLVPQQMNPKRRLIISQMQANISEGNFAENVYLNNKFMSLSRGKGRH